MALYNEIRYNEGQYQYILLNDVASLSDSRAIDINKTLSDSAFLNDNLTKQITNKGLFDSVRTADWMLKQRVNETEWIDQ